MGQPIMGIECRHNNWLTLLFVLMSIVILAYKQPMPKGSNGDWFYLTFRVEFLASVAFIRFISFLISFAKEKVDCARRTLIAKKPDAQGKKTPHAEYVDNICHTTNCIFYFVLLGVYEFTAFVRETFFKHSHAKSRSFKIWTNAINWPFFMIATIKQKDGIVTTLFVTALICNTNCVVNRFSEILAGILLNVCRRFNWRGNDKNCIFWAIYTSNTLKIIPVNAVVLRVTKILVEDMHKSDWTMYLTTVYFISQMLLYASSAFVVMNPLNALSSCICRLRTLSRESSASELFTIVKNCFLTLVPLLFIFRDLYAPKVKKQGFSRWAMDVCTQVSSGFFEDYFQRV